MKAILLARVSTEMQEDGFSLDAQLERLRNYCNNKKLSIIKEFTFVESSFKGKRTKFYEAIQFVKRQNEKTAIVVDTVDRLQRSFNEFPLLMNLVKAERIELHFYKEGLTINENYKSSDLAMWQLQILSANMYVNSTRDNVRRSEEKMLKEGLLPGPAPIGYLNTKDENGRKTIIIDPQRGLLVKKIYEEYATGLFSMDELVKKTKQWGLKNKKSGRYVTKSQLAKILQNPFYYGVMFYNKTNYPHRYEKLISKELFDKCTEIRTGKYKRTAKHTKEPYIFSGLVRCHYCGCLLSPYKQKGKYIYLRHTAIKDCKHCDNINEKMLLEEVEKHLSSIVLDDEIRVALSKKLKHLYDLKNQNTYYHIETSKNELEELCEKENRLVDLLVKEIISEEIYKQQMANITTKKIELQETISRTETPNSSVFEAIDKVLNYGENSFKLFKSSRIEEKRRILKNVFSNFFMEGKNPLITMYKHFNLLSKIGGCKDWCSEKDLNLHGKTPTST